MKAFNKKRRPKHSVKLRYHFINFNLIVVKDNLFLDDYIITIDDYTITMNNKTFKNLKQSSNGFLKFNNICIFGDDLTWMDLK